MDCYKISLSLYVSKSKNFYASKNPNRLKPGKIIKQGEAEKNAGLFNFTYICSAWFLPGITITLHCNHKEVP